MTVEKICFVFRNIKIGGSELLIERLGKELKERSIPVCVIYQSIDPMMINRFRDPGIQRIKVKAWNRKSILDSLETPAACCIVTFSWYDFLICNIRKDSVHTVFYAIHYKELILMAKHAPLSRAVQQTVKRGILSLIGSRQLICMDEQTIDYAKRFYHFEKLDIPILRIAVNVVPAIRREQHRPEIHLLTITRADFPFKSYLFGLIDWAADADENVFLTIVSYGQDENQLKKKIDALSEESRCRIRWAGKTDYDQLSAYYQETDLYVGMGTTVLDASIRGIVSIPVQAYTSELSASHFFFEDYRKVALDEGSGEAFDRLFRRYIGMDDQDKALCSQRSRDAVIENYSAPMIADQLLFALSSVGPNRTTAGLELIRRLYAARSRFRRV